MNLLKRIKAFTLAEVLLSLTIIGIISSLTIPAVLNNGQKRANAALVKKAIAKLDMVIELATTEPQFQPQLKSYYWKDRKNPPDGCTHEEYYDDNGELQWRYKDGCTPKTGNPNGDFAHTPAFWEYLVNNMQVTKYCESAYTEGCTPEYKGNETIASDKYPKGDDETDEAYRLRISNQVKGCRNFNSENIKTRPAFVTNDGMIFIAYSKQLPVYLVDINGKKGPNKFGYDVFFLQITGYLGEMPMATPGNCEMIEKGGSSTASMIIGKF